MPPRAVIGGMLLVAATTAASADPVGATDPSPRRPSPIIALSLSLGVTAAGASLILAGRESETFDSEIFVVGGGAMLVGPSIGRWYAGIRSGRGLAARGVATAIMLVAIVASEEAGCDEEHGDGCPDGPADGGWEPVFYAGAALWVGSSLYDIVRAPLDAREYNRAHSFAVAPTIVPGGAGLTVGGSF